jgi:hypothetical protein
LIIVGINKYFKKVRKGLLIFPCVAIRKFCGLPMGLVTLLMVIANANAIRRIFGFILCFFARSKTIGVPK